MDTAASRRRFLRYLAASPLLAASGEALAQAARLPDPAIWGPRTLEPLIDMPHRAASVFDFEPVAHNGAPSLRQLVPAMVRRI